jgi:3-phenylpropionate/trans-cinnamate dioxygenase ferredoxin reductase component
MPICTPRMGLICASAPMWTPYWGPGVVEAVRLSDGAIPPAELVVVGIGVEPWTEVDKSVGLSIDNGIAVDEFLQTSVPGIYAAGDVANPFHPTQIWSA